MASKPVVGAQLYTLRKFCRTESEIVETFKKVADIGYSTVQLSGLGPVEPDAVAAALKDAGLTAAATHVSWERLREDLDAVIAEHKLWGCVHPAIGGLPGEYLCAEGVGRFLEELAPVAERLQQEGMDFSYHNHAKELARFDGKTWLGMLYEQADPGLLKAEIDTYWIVAGGGDPVSWIRCCAGREPLLHLKDMVVLPDQTQRMAEVGEGNLNWPAILDAACESGVEYLLVEQDHCYERDPFESLAISYRNLKAMGFE